MSIYAPLDPSRNQMRVLHLSPGRDTDELRCTLTTVSLREDPKYEALSYVWGENTGDTLPMLVGNHTVKVTRNLDSALRGIRHVDCERILWIDALCINQRDKAEVESKSAKNHI